MKKLTTHQRRRMMRRFVEKARNARASVSRRQVSIAAARLYRAAWEEDER